MSGGGGDGDIIHTLVYNIHLQTASGQYMLLHTFLLSSRFFAKEKKRKKSTLNVRKDHHISKCAYLSLWIHVLCYTYGGSTNIYVYDALHTHAESRPLCTSPRTRRRHSYISLSIKGNPFQSAASHYKRLCQSSSITSYMPCRHFFKVFFFGPSHLVRAGCV